ncbi:ABC transporter ATP-binding protein [Sedimentibacter sp. zth1]|uniref:ABC transporter ATP-binding protein n=1 Tax=Sedimentibacter sp. zth1 TaxID=2816908 RepID=UPI001A92BF50|nr:ABC transporter ATP-binding protein [Sedimentibacter sp. zth1]QSX05254.1 ABC transporter ATP-binding protein [Sedimentibacter sp. zth1]
MGKVILKNISHRYDKTNVLNDINIEIEDGDLFTLLGPSGCGKTTLLRIIAGFIKPTSGKVYLYNQDITNLSPEQRNIGIVFQNYALFSHMNVLENVTYGLKIKKYNKHKIKDISDYYLNLVGMYDYKDRNINELSGGQQQRVALARSLAIEPKVLLLDEPLSNLDAALRDKMREEISKLQKKLKITTVFITHDQKEALAISDKIAVFNNGKCMQVDTPQNIYNNPQNEFVANFVGETNTIYIEDKEPIFIRPENIKIFNEKKNDNFVSGKIQNITFNGSTIEYKIKVDTKIYKAIELNDGKSYRKINDEVYIEIDTVK